MKTKYFGAVIWLLLVVSGCDKNKEEVLPFDENPIVKNIKFPGSFIFDGSQTVLPDYVNMHIGYSNNEILYITNRGDYGGKIRLIDSTYFYYVNDKIDYATRVESNSPDPVINPRLESYRYIFERSAAGDITGAKLESTDGTVHKPTHFTYKNGKVASITYEQYVDSVAYNQKGNVSSIKTYSLPSRWRSTLTEVLDITVSEHALSHSPLYQISKKLGFPVFASTFTGTNTFKLNELSANPVKSTNAKFYSSANQYVYLFDVDKKGRVVAQYTEASRNQKTTFEYY